MKSRGKSKKPPGIAGENQVPPEEPVILDSEGAEAAKAVSDAYYYTGHQVFQLHAIDFGSTPMMATYRLVEAVLEERMRSLPVALAKNAARHGWRDRWADWTAAAGAGAAAGATIDPLVGLGVAVVTGMARNVVEVWKLRRGRHKEIAPGRSKAGAEIRMMIHEAMGDLPSKIDLRGKLPDLPEFNNEWVRLAYRLVRLAMGYNVRVDVVNRIRLELARAKMPKETAAMLVDVADGMTDMLLNVRPRLLEVRDVLIELQPVDFRNLRRLAEHDDQLQTNDLLGDGYGSEEEDDGRRAEDRAKAATLLWLDVPYDHILIKNAARVHETDIAVFEGRIALDEELSLEMRFEKLENEIRAEKDRLEGELSKLAAEIEGLPPEERPAALEKLENIRRRLRELAELDATLAIEITVDDSDP